MSIATRILLPPAILACGLALSAPAGAATVYEYVNPAVACQLSIPTTDTKVRPKASGYRNESDSNGAFVICGYGKPTSSSSITQINLTLLSMDGASHSVDCTAVSAVNGTNNTQKYVTKTAVVSGTNGITVTWNPGDFGSTSGDIPFTPSPSVTCILPPQTAITQVIDAYNQ
ncbi:hypothetical protein FNZ56_12150 [Pseudoluteimonas lycopersici]|uniref:Spore coat protein U domain-containing protein n=1 Tax=Pseudoluteimonas lycopersici TaxID=1324796 RepID=A0A516V7R8_9GAMM|nr:hypothetical protein [Lysobacter lycopersici]QDQ74579.1 hypothetical protein FNZ56_12150 [Lysobacter lycopersici]